MTRETFIKKEALHIARECWEKETGEPYEGSGYEMQEPERMTNIIREQYKVVFTHPTKKAVQVYMGL